MAQNHALAGSSTAITILRNAQNAPYAWSAPIEGSAKRRFFAVLHQPPITSPVDAIRAVIIAEQKRGAP